MAAVGVVAVLGVFWPTEVYVLDVTEVYLLDVAGSEVYVGEASDPDVDWAKIFSIAVIFQCCPVWSPSPRNSS